jgi:hypothetical protein
MDGGWLRCICVGGHQSSGLPFFDPHTSAVDYTYLSDPRAPLDTAYVVPHLNPASGSGTPDISGDGWTAVWQANNGTAALATLKSQLQVGDVVRFYKYGDTTDHRNPELARKPTLSSSSPISGANVQVVDNWSAGQTGKTGQHSFDDFSAWATGGNVHSAIISRLNSQFVTTNVPSSLQGWGLGDWTSLSGAAADAITEQCFGLTSFPADTANLRVATVWQRFRKTATR